MRALLIGAVLLSGCDQVVPEGPFGASYNECMMKAASAQSAEMALIACRNHYTQAVDLFVPVDATLRNDGDGAYMAFELSPSYHEYEITTVRVTVSFYKDEKLTGDPEELVWEFDKRLVGAAEETVYGRLAGTAPSRYFTAQAQAARAIRLAEQ